MKVLVGVHRFTTKFKVYATCAALLYSGAATNLLHTQNKIDKFNKCSLKLTQQFLFRQNPYKNKLQLLFKHIVFF